MSYQAHGKAAAQLTALATMFVLFGFSSVSALDVDAEKLRGLVETEKNAGQVKVIHLVEAYQAVGITAAHPTIESARAWAESFCAHASSRFVWDRKWTLIVYVDQHEQPAYSCRIPTMPSRFSIY